MDKGPKLDGDELVLRGLCLRQGIIPPSRQLEVWSAISRVLDRKNAEIKRLEAVAAKFSTIGEEEAVSDYPNLEALSRGCVSGHSANCVCLQPEAKDALAEIANLKAAIRGFAPAAATMEAK